MNIKVSDYIAEFLVKKGITQVFSVTGGGAMHLNDSLGACKGLDIVYNHHEQACAIAAEGYARTSGKMAAVVLTTGPGGTNGITGVLGAWLDSIPMFVISGQVKYETTVRSSGLNLRQLGDQEFDITKSVACMTKYAEMVIDPLSIDYHLQCAYDTALDGRMGPVWLDIPLNVQSANIDTTKLQKYTPAKKTNPIPSDKQIQKCIDTIKNASRPVFLFGSGIRMAGAREQAIKLAEKLNIPVVTSFGGHDLFPNDHPLYSGRPGTIGTRGGNYVVQNADVVVVFASRLNIRQISYNWENFAKNAFKIIVDIDEHELKKPTVKPDLAIHCDVKNFIEALLASNLGKFDKNDWLDYCRIINEKYNHVKMSTIEPDSKVNPYYAAEQIVKAGAAGEVFVSSNASVCICPYQSGLFDKGKKIFSNSGSAPMGYGLPAAIGAYMAKGNRIICLEGDGSLMMNLQELQTIAHYKMDMIIFLFNNDGYISIKQTQNNFFKRLNGADSSSNVTTPEFKKVADAFGLKYTRINNNSEIESGVKKVYQQRGPILCEIIIDESQGFSPKLSARTLPDGSMVSPSLEDMFPFIDREEHEQNMKISRRKK